MGKDFLFTYKILSIFLWIILAAMFLVWIPAFLIQSWHADLILSQGFYSGYPAGLHTRLAVSAAALFFTVFVFRDHPLLRIFPPMILLLGITAFLKAQMPFYAVLLLILIILFFKGFDAAEERIQFWASYLLSTALLSGITGSLFLIFSEADHRPYLFETGKSLMFNGFVMLTFPGLFLRTEKERPESDYFTLPSFFSGAALVLFLLSFLGELLIFAGTLNRMQFHIPGFMRFLAFSVWIITLFPLKKHLQYIRSLNSFFYIIFNASIPLGVLGHALFRDFRGHFSHIAFTAGLFPLILRLIQIFFPPSGKKKDFIPAFALRIVFTLILAAGFFRILAGMSDLTDFTELVTAALLITAGFVIFGYYYFRSVF